jgi:FKBP-type peptidyl-prolyl cis-trans isomerase 2
VKVEYRGTLDDETVFDSTENHGPLEFEVGAEQVIESFENAVIGMEKGEEKEIKLQPSEAYGDHDPKLIRKIPRIQLPEGELKPGMMLLMNLPNGIQLPAEIKEVTDETVTLDLNHPLAGKTLNFKIKVIDISS